MKRFRFAWGLVLFSLSAVGSPAAGQGGERPVVAVSDFAVPANAPKALAWASRGIPDLLQERLQNQGVTVLDRQMVGAMLNEMRLQDANAGSRTLAFGQMLGARQMIVGTVEPRDGDRIRISATAVSVPQNLQVATASAEGSASWELHAMLDKLARELVAGMGLAAAQPAAAPASRSIAPEALIRYYRALNAYSSGNIADALRDFQRAYETDIRLTQAVRWEEKIYTAAGFPEHAAIVRTMYPTLFARASESSSKPRAGLPVLALAEPVASKEDSERLAPLIVQVKEALRAAMPSCKEAQGFRPDTIPLVAAEFDTRLTAGADVQGVAESEQWTRVDAILTSRLELRNREPVLTLTVVEADSLKVLAQEQKPCRPAEAANVVPGMLQTVVASWRHPQKSAPPGSGVGPDAAGPSAPSPWTRRSVFFSPGGEMPERNAIRLLRNAFHFWDTCTALDRTTIDRHMKATADAIWQELTHPRQWDVEWELAAYEFFRIVAPPSYKDIDRPRYEGIMNLIFEHRPASLAAAFVHQHLAQRSKNPQEKSAELLKATGILCQLQQNYPQEKTYEVLWTRAQLEYAQALTDAGQLDAAREALRPVKDEQWKTLNANVLLDFGPGPDVLKVPERDLFRFGEENPVGVLRAKLDMAAKGSSPNNSHYMDLGPGPDALKMPECDLFQFCDGNPVGVLRVKLCVAANGPAPDSRVDAGFEQMALEALFGEVGARYHMGDYKQPIEDLQPQLNAIRGGLVFQALKPKLDIYRGYAETIIQDWNAHDQVSPDHAPPGTEYILAFVLHAPVTPEERLKWGRRAAAALLKTRKIAITREAADREGPALARKLSTAHRILTFAGDKRNAEQLYENLLRNTDSIDTMVMAAAFSGFSLEFWQQTLKPKLVRLFALNTAHPRPIPPLLANQVALRLTDISRFEDARWLIDAAVRLAELSALKQEEWRQVLARWLEVHDLLQTSKQTDAIMAQLPALVRVRARYTEVNALKRIQKYELVPDLLVQLIQEAKRARLRDDEFCCSDPYRDLLALLSHNTRDKDRVDKIARRFKACPPSACENEQEIYYCAALMVFRARKYGEAAELFELNTQGERYRVDNQFLAASSWALAGQPEKAIPLYREAATAKLTGRRPHLQVLDFTTERGVEYPTTGYMDVKIDMAKTAQLHLRILRERLPIEMEWDRDVHIRGVLTGVDMAARAISYRGTRQWIVPYPDETIPFYKLNETQMAYLKKVALVDNPEVAVQIPPLRVSDEMRAAGYMPPSASLAPFRQDSAWENSLGMKFVRIPKTDLWFGIWETRVQDFEAMSNYERKDALLHPAYPASSRFEATKFCKWLTERDAAAGRLPAEFYYRLPTEAEWWHAAGVALPPNLSLEEKKKFGASHFPWGAQWPPPREAGNLAGQEISSLEKWKSLVTPIDGYRDPYPELAPVGRFPPNAFGLYDMAGNAAEVVWEGNGVGGSCVDGERDFFGAFLLQAGEHKLFSIRPVGFRVVIARRPPGPPSLGVQPIVSGQAWTNSLGMAFVWVESWKVWASASDITVQDVRMCDPWSSFGLKREYATWGMTGIEYSKWLTQREYASRALPEAYEYRAATQKELTDLKAPAPTSCRLIIHPVQAGNVEPPPPPPAPLREPVPLASSEFKWQYAMDVGAHTQDLDRNGKGDFWDGGNELPRVENGIAVFDVGDRYRTDFMGSLTRGVLKCNGDCTVEVRVRVHPDSREGPAGVLAVALRDQDNSCAFLYIGKQTVKYYNSLAYPEEKAEVVAEGDNTDGFHVFRLTRKSYSSSEFGAVYVWRDGVLLKAVHGELYITGPNGLIVGDNGPAVEGSFDVDYIRIHDDMTYPPARRE